MTLLPCSYYYKNYLITLNTCTIRLVIRSTRVTTRSTGLPNLSTPMPIRSTCLSIRLSIRNICLSTCVVLVLLPVGLFITDHLLIAFSNIS